MNVEINLEKLRTESERYYGQLGAYDFFYDVQFKYVEISFRPGFLNYSTTAKNLDEAKTAIIAGIIDMQNKIMPIKVTLTGEEK